jgi:hypothetical protein
VSTKPDFVPQFDSASNGIRNFFEKHRHIDWNKVVEHYNRAVKNHIEAAQLLAEKGWTIPTWMSLSDPLELCRLSETELDSQFTAVYIENDFRILNERTAQLTETPEMSPWKALLLEIRDSIIAGRHLIAVPALLTIIEGYAVKIVLKPGPQDPSRTNLFKLFSETNLHQANGIEAMPAVYNLTFLRLLFADSRFDQTPPPRINRHWALHGRDECNWSLADVVRLLNALETLVWLDDIRCDRPAR